MHVKFRFPTNVLDLGRVVPKQIIALAPSVAVPLIARGLATPINFSGSVPPDTDEEMEKRRRKAREQGQDAEWDRRPPKQPRAAVFAQAYYPPAEESFETKVVKAVKARAAASPYTRKAAEERAEKERSRYRPLRPRKRTKGE